MKKSMLFLSLLLLMSTPSFSADPLVLDDSGKLPVKFTYENLPATIGKAVEIKLKYEWHNWSKNEFEENQNAAGKIKYTYSVGKVAGGLHSYGAQIKLDIKEEDDFNFWISSVMDDKGGYGTGNGLIFINFYCSYKGKDRKRHKGKIGSMTINANFVAPR